MLKKPVYSTFKRKKNGTGNQSKFRVSVEILTMEPKENSEGRSRTAKNLSCPSNEETCIGIYKFHTSQSGNIQSTETE